MDDDVTDLTEDAEEPAPASKDKPKKEKAPKVEKPPKAKKEKAPKENDDSKSGAAGIVLIMILIVILLIGGFGAVLFFDLFSSRQIVGDVVNDPLIRVVTWLDPRFNTIEQQLVIDAETQSKQHAERTEELDIREENIVFLENDIATREQLLERRALELDNREAQIIAMYERTVPIHRREMTEEELEDMISLSRTFSRMSPEDAAKILRQLYDPRDVAAILYYMTERNASAILSTMDERYAAELTEILLYS